MLLAIQQLAEGADPGIAGQYAGPDDRPGALLSQQCGQQFSQSLGGFPVAVVGPGAQDLRGSSVRFAQIPVCLWRGCLRA